MKKYKVGMVSLGCDKNRVDAEIILGRMSEQYEITNNPKEADIIIVNTCGFIESAKQESIDTILEMAEYKNKYKCKMLIATGCLTQRYGKELQELMPEIDITLGVNDYEKINEYIMNFINNDEKLIEVNYSDQKINEGIRILTTKSHTAYLRIAEGCNNFCTYCIIPKIRGKFRSRDKESIIKEAELLSKSGVKELILIAQDLTMYGTDLYGGQKLHELLRELSKVDGIEWIRLLYCYPEEIYDELIDEIANNNKVVKYLDLPIQHISNNILRLMARKTSKEAIINKIETLRKRIPDIVVRTSLIVGFPGETEEDFIDTLVRINKELSTTIIMTEHNLEDIYSVCDKVIVMEDGKVICNDTNYKVADILSGDKNHKMFKSLPTPSKIYNQLNGYLEGASKSPLTVKDCRQWLNDSMDELTITKLDDTETEINIDEKDREIAIELKDVYFQYNKISEPTIRDLSFKVYKGEIYSILGGNGTGKSTT